MKYTITGSSKNFTILYSTTKMRDLIGLTANTTSVNNSMTLDTVNLMPSTELQIRLPHMIANYESSKTNLNQDIIQVVSLSGYQYTQVIRENMSSVECALLNDFISSITVSVVDQTGIYT